MSDVPVNAPSACPGSGSDAAGKTSACAGCPNQSLCASGEAKKPLSEREPELVNSIKKQMARVRRRIIVLSGKGGVGKTSISVSLARALSHKIVTDSSGQNRQLNVGILDLDICGPSVPCMLGALDETVHESKEGWAPVYINENLSALSTGFILTSPDQALIMRGPRKDALISQFLTKALWTDDQSQLDYLVIDTPPGTSDEILSLVTYLKAADCCDFALVVSTPQDVSLNDVRKSLDFCKKVNLPVLGVVENMSDFVCPRCDKTSEIFPRTGGGAEALAAAHSLSLLVKIPIDPRFTRYLDEGLDPFNFEDQVDESYRIPAEAPVIQSFQQLVTHVIKF
ncbi:hypothetical protein Ciccas_005620 [Cichlidogyrus casuarinus]|uniref:Cytosolic Fe-S cluster assembly factor NUBP1 homolog n=1 Tax=Cichlidogyrus casuarinus TaxID=1844966 RepID=A0ABD2Q930_9PLAT